MNGMRWVACLVLTLTSARAEVVNSPIALAFSPDGQQIAVSDYTASSLVWVDAAHRQVINSVKLKGNPSGIAWSGGKIYVAEYDAGSVAEIDPVSGRVARRLAVGPKPSGVAVATGKRLLLAADFGLANVVMLDLDSGEERNRIDVLPQPGTLAVAPNETLAAVAHLAPTGDARQGSQASAVTLLDLNTMVKAAELRLPPGSSNVRGIAFSPDGRWIYTVHTIGQFNLPTTQLERGWISVNAMTILDATNRTVHTTVLLDQVNRGAANPWGIAVSPDGQYAWITLAGAQELARVNLGALHARLEGKTPADAAAGAPGGIWAEIAKDPARRTELQNDLAALYAAKLIERYPLPGNGPRGVALSPDGARAAVAAYFSGTVLVLNTAAPRTVIPVAVGAPCTPGAARRGEQAFHDATLCFQSWLSCATCHPSGRADGLNWDLLNDGAGNPKNTKSLVWSHQTPPAMALGVRASMDMATAKGFHFIQFHVVDEATVEDVREYLRCLAPEKSPYLVKNKLSAKAKKGRKVFTSPEVGCARCHPEPLLTNLKMYDVGTAGELDRDATEFDTPTCIEMWLTPPYLHDGSAPTLLDMLTTLNPDDRHGRTSQLSKEELDALVEYLLSL